MCMKKDKKAKKVKIDYTEIYRKRILCILKQSGSKPVPFRTLYAKCKGKKDRPDMFKQALRNLEGEGAIFEKKGGFVVSMTEGVFPATVSRVNKTFGFIRRNDDNTEVFVPGKFLMGAMPNDVVLARLIPAKGEKPEGEVVRIVEENFSQFSGTVISEGARMLVSPDSLTKEPLEIVGSECDYQEGDKVLAEVCRRGQRHSEHKVKIIMKFGSSDDASSSAKAVLMLAGVETEFPSEVIDEAKHAENIGIPDGETEKRLDLRDLPIFTIDGADTKDIDDAVYVKETEDGFELDVCIADVSYYVKPKSALDNDALLRGTSIYYADKVIPMLPKELSNGICSLNPQEDRLSFACLMKLSKEGELVKFKFSKAVIRSRVKGVYSEINRILKGDADDAVNEKYAEVKDVIPAMKKLADILTANKIKRGAPQLDTPECKLILDENDRCIDVKRRERGEAEVIIEEFMLMANTCAAKLARENEIPFVYRVHEDPSAEKIADLREACDRLGLAMPQFTTVKPVHLAELLKSVEDSDLKPVINNMVLRSMAKARYADEPLGHFGLVLEDYAHFTSPIRRYPDLAIHRILTDLCYNKLEKGKLKKRYEAFAKNASEQSSACELTAMRVERECEDCYMAEYMRSHLGEEFEGMISGVTEYGFYVELENTVEGLVRMETLPEEGCEYDGMFSVTKDGKTLYKVGDKVKVVCTKAAVSSGLIDFDIARPEEND